MFFKPVYILILGFTIVIDYFAGIFIENAVGYKRKTFLIISLIANIGVLAIFKYYNFFIENINSFAPSPFLPYLSILLPIGLSFHTFQAMSYTIEVYRGNQKAERHFGIYALYVMFYPQLVAGPIERPQNVLYQFHIKHHFSYENVTNGLKLMAWGMFKKVVVGDHLAIMVDKVYNNPTQYEGLPLIIATVFFAFQIYCDFSGYSDIALGSAQVMGFKLMQNFDRPYFSKSISEFWRRWHISLSTWFRDYLYIPLGGSRVPYYRQLFNLFIVFMVSGLWHGASWNFIIWGALHGLLLVLARLRERFLPTLHLKANNLVAKIIHILIVFILVDFCWVFFRARTFADAKYIITHLFSNISLNSLKNVDFVRNNILLGESKQLFLVTVLSLVLMEIVHYFQRNLSIRSYLSTQNKWLRWGLYCLLISWILLFGAFEKPAQFIYFQF
ncbi:alginate O-acetyltransferase [Emticicia aquatilis]|uniref:Alginate O-acetyltransferase n=2 Tax=Emticicia aquatilis TaxID=1537369 RepID=A0A916YZG3_9BACT|nr:alginate O-acetyltransferase [Emticicia aquatilis]